MLTAEESYEFGLLVLCVYREARSESLDAQHAVAWTIKNRVTKGGWFGKSWSGVILKPLQFSSFNGPDKNGHVDANALTFPIPETDPAFGSCLLASKHVYEGTQFDPTAGATHYHDKSIPTPAWAESMTRTLEVGKLVFYRQ